MQIKYANLIENTDAFRSLVRDIECGRLSHAYLLVSPDTMALDILTDMFLARVVADGYDGSKANAVFTHNMGDIIRLPLEGDKVKVADINHLTDTAYYTPTELERKYYVISYGETMNEPSQNKLLKTLEEPPAVTGIIIKTSSADRLLPTVLSRCRTVTLEPFTAKALYEELEPYCPGTESLKFATESSRGLLTRTLEILSSPVYLKLYELAGDMLTKLSSSGGIAEYASRLYDYRENITDIIDFTELLLFEAMRAHAGREASELSAEISERFSVNAILKETEVLSRARRRLELNGNVTAVIDELLFSMLEVRAKWK